MKKLKGILSIFLVSLICLNCSVLAYERPLLEENIIESVSYSEYDVYKKLMSTSDEVLADEGFSPEEIEEIRSFSLESAFLERAQLDENSLKVLGYTDEQIRILKRYNGEPITDSSEILRAASSCTGELAVYSTSGTAMYYGYKWTWSSLPLKALGERVALSWRGIDAGGYTINASATSKSGYVNYYSTLTGQLYDQPTLSVRAADIFDGCYADYEMIRYISNASDGTTSVWAKEGILNVRIVPDGSTPFNLIKTYGAIGHQTSRVSLGFSVGGGR